MKASFYFVLWILIYPILGLLDNSFIDNNAFLVAIAIVWGLNWLLNRLMSKTVTYERALAVAPILEDVYTGNVASFGKRLTRDLNIGFVMTIYFVVSTIVICFVDLGTGVNGWIEFAVFAFFTSGGIFHVINLRKEKTLLSENPTAEQCMKIAVETYRLDYASYYVQRQTKSSEEMLPSRPRHFKVFQIISIVIAGIAVSLGLTFIGVAFFTKLGASFFEAGAISGMCFLYGSLATYCGITDMNKISQNLKTIKPRSNKLTKNQSNPISNQQNL